MYGIRLAELKDVIYLKEIVDDSISINYYSEEDIKDFINDESYILYVYADENDCPVALLLCETGDLSDLCIKEHIPFENNIFSKYSRNTKAVIYKTAATKKENRNSGILTEFLKQAGIEFQSIKHELKMCLCLILPSGKIPVHNHVTNDGFVQIKRYKSPWSGIKSYCSYCNNEYCSCDGMLYIKENFTC